MIEGGAQGHLADPRDRQCRTHRDRRLPQAGDHRRHGLRLGLRNRIARRRRARPPSRKSRRPPASFTPTRRRARRCWTTRRSTSRAWLADEIAAKFARAEGAAFVTGNGTNKPKGFLDLHGDQRGRQRPRFRLAAISRVGCGGRLCGVQSAGQAHRSRPGAEPRLSAGCGVRDELGDAGADPQVQDLGRRLPLAAGAGGRARPRRCSAIR